ncbi:MAG: hypothetical protein LBN05_04030 [Oscillospiraceae bacterium]|jgi:hypothetical protein|nr:hypothetical protein [Oscillospiraceae bacterium]
MDNMLQKVLETDHREAERTQMLAQTRETLFEDLRAQKEELFAQARADAAVELEGVRTRLEAQTAERLAALRTKTTRAQKILAAFAADKSDVWAEALVTKVLAG